MIRRTIRLVPVLFVAACTPAQSQAPPPASNPIIAWLDCVECTAAQLNAVAALGNAAVPELARVLSSGPPPDRLSQQQRYLQTRYRGMKDYERQHPDQRVTLTEDQFVQRYTQKFVLLNRMRAARALGRIATPAATDALKQAQQQANLPEDLRVEIAQALSPRRNP